MSQKIKEFHEHSKVHEVTESNLDGILQEVISHFDIGYFARQAYPNDKDSDIARLAFKEHVKIQFKSALICFYITKKHQLKNIPLYAYLKVVLSRLASRLAFDELLLKKRTSLICPRCELIGQKIFLSQEGDLFRCYDCTKIVEEKTSSFPVVRECKIFSLHSKAGFECPECHNWMPISIVLNDKIQCPYSSCMFFGSVSDLKRITHPFSFKYQRPLSLNDLVFNLDSKSDLTFLDLFGEQSDAENSLIFKENIYDIYNLIIQIVDKQIAFLKKNNSQKTLMQKVLAFETFKVLLFQFPSEIINLFAFEKIDRNFIVLCKAFQQYTDLLENCLPFSYKFKNKTVECVSLNDPNLGLFAGISTFNAKIKDNYCHNYTKEIYTTINKYDSKQYFIGKIIDVVQFNERDKKYISLFHKVTEYSFNKIYFSDVPDETEVLIKHYRIAPHYQMGHLVFLQRAIRIIKDKLYFLLNNKKRTPRKKNVEIGFFDY